MQFLIVAYDGLDDDALNRRMAAREAHLALVETNKAAGHAKYGAALLDESGKMIGSMMVVEYENQEALENWLKDEPYITQRVWEDVSISACKVAPSFT